MSVYFNLGNIGIDTSAQEISTVLQDTCSTMLDHGLMVDQDYFPNAVDAALASMEGHMLMGDQTLAVNKANQVVKILANTTRLFGSVMLNPDVELMVIARLLRSNLLDYETSAELVDRAQDLLDSTATYMESAVLRVDYAEAASEETVERESALALSADEAIQHMGEMINRMPPLNVLQAGEWDGLEQTVMLLEKALTWGLHFPIMRLQKNIIEQHLEGNAHRLDSYEPTLLGYMCKVIGPYFWGNESDKAELARLYRRASGLSKMRKNDPFRYGTIVAAQAVFYMKAGDQKKAMELYQDIAEIPDPDGMRAVISAMGPALIDMRESEQERVFSEFVTKSQMNPNLASAIFNHSIHKQILRMTPEQIRGMRRTKFIDKAVSDTIFSAGHVYAAIGELDASHPIFLLGRTAMKEQLRMLDLSDISFEEAISILMPLLTAASKNRAQGFNNQKQFL